MSQLVQNDYDLFLDCIRELYSIDELPALRLWLLEEALPKLLSSDWFSYNEVDLLHPANTLAILKPEAGALFQRLFPRFQEVVHQHPLVTRQLQSPEFAVYKISDFLTQEDYHRLELYQDVYRHLGVEYQIAVTIRTEPARVTAFALSRRQNDYTERDRAILEMLRPHLVVAFNNLALARENMAIQDTTSLALNALASATIIVNSQGRILYHTGPGLKWIGAASPEVLPTNIYSWLNPPAGRRARRIMHLATATGEIQIRAVPTNSPALAAFRYHVMDLWRSSLRRRSQKDHMTWERMLQLADDWLPKPTILHPWPSARFAVRHPRWEPYAGKLHVRFCAGGAQ